MSARAFINGATVYRVWPEKDASLVERVAEFQYVTLADTFARAYIHEVWQGSTSYLMIVDNYSGAVNFVYKPKEIA